MDTIKNYTELRIQKLKEESRFTTLSPQDSSREERLYIELNHIIRDLMQEYAHLLRHDHCNTNTRIAVKNATIRDIFIAFDEICKIRDLNDLQSELEGIIDFILASDDDIELEFLPLKGTK